MIYVLNLGEDNRVLSIAFDSPYLSEVMPRVKDVPDEVLNSEKVDNYKYDNGEYIYDPLPEPEPEPEPEPGDELTTEDMANAITEGVNEV